MTQLTYYGHACFSLTHGEETIIFDPFLTGNTWNIAQANDIKCKYIFISHAHADHYGDAEEIALANDALIISTAEIAGKVAEAGCRAHAMHLGGKYDFPFGSVRMVPAYHGSGIPGGHAAGCIVTFYDKVLYFAGDTALFSDMKLLTRFGKIDYALLPIGDNFTMGIEDALLAASWIKAAVTIPIHYKTWPVIDKDPQEFTHLLEIQHGQAGLVVAPGETITI